MASAKDYVRGPTRAPAPPWLLPRPLPSPAFRPPFRSLLCLSHAHAHALRSLWTRRPLHAPRLCVLSSTSSPCPPSSLSSSSFRRSSSFSFPRSSSLVVLLFLFLLSRSIDLLSLLLSLPFPMPCRSMPALCTCPDLADSFALLAATRRVHRQGRVRRRVPRGARERRRGRRDQADQPRGRRRDRARRGHGACTSSHALPNLRQKSWAPPLTRASPAPRLRSPRGRARSACWNGSRTPTLCGTLLPTKTTTRSTSCSSTACGRGRGREGEDESAWARARAKARARSRTRPRGRGPGHRQSRGWAAGHVLTRPLDGFAGSAKTVP